jgi:hypothetical protein
MCDERRRPEVRTLQTKTDANGATKAAAAKIRAAVTRLEAKLASMSRRDAGRSPPRSARPLSARGVRGTRAPQGRSHEPHHRSAPMTRTVATGSVPAKIPARLHPVCASSAGMPTQICDCTQPARFRRGDYASCDAARLPAGACWGKKRPPLPGWCFAPVPCWQGGGTGAPGSCRYARDMSGYAFPLGRSFVQRI